MEWRQQFTLQIIEDAVGPSSVCFEFLIPGLEDKRQNTAFFLSARSQHEPNPACQQNYERSSDAIRRKIIRPLLFVAQRQKWMVTRVKKIIRPGRWLDSICLCTGCVCIWWLPGKALSIDVNNYFVEIGIASWILNIFICQWHTYELLGYSILERCPTCNAIWHGIHACGLDKWQWLPWMAVKPAR